MRPFFFFSKLVISAFEHFTVRSLFTVLLLLTAISFTHPSRDTTEPAPRTPFQPESTMRLLLLSLALPIAMANPIPTGDFNDIERRWAEGHSEVCAASAFLPGCYIHAWVVSVSRVLWSSSKSVSASNSSPSLPSAWEVRHSWPPHPFILPSQNPLTDPPSSPQQQIHTGLTHRDMTPAWPMHARDSSGEAFATATDERSIQASVLRTRAGSLLEQMKDFAERFLRSKGLDSVIARRSGKEMGMESVPVLRPRKGVRWKFGDVE